MDILTDYLRRLQNERQKIAFTGTHSVGKTTIINHLAERMFVQAEGKHKSYFNLCKISTKSFNPTV